MKKEKLLVISQYFYPEQFRINDMCKEWVKRGKEVTVVTGIPNYPQGKYFEGYGLFKKRKENFEGISIVRIPLITRGKSAIGMILNYLSFVVSGFFWSHFTKVQADKVFIFEVSPMTQALVGVWYAKRKKIPCTIYVQDLWPENVEVVTGIQNKWILGAISKMCDYIYCNCSRILATSPSFVKRLEERNSVWNYDGNSKVTYWPQYAEEFYEPVERKDMPDLKDDGVFKIMFTGNIGYAQGLDILPRTAEVLQAKGVQCQFVLVGNGRYRESMEMDIASRGVETMFCFTGEKIPTQIPEYMALSDVAFLSFKRSHLFEMTIPAKLQSYMACAKPIIAVADGETARIIKEAQCGFVCEFEDPDKLAACIMKCMRERENLANMGKMAQEYCYKHFDKKELMNYYETNLQR